MKKINNIFFYFLFLALTGCTEPFPIETIEFEETLVVESTITNEMKRQVVKVSRTIPLESFGQEIEDNAVVRIEGSDGSIFDFSQDTDTGSYISNIEFQAVPNVGYTLKITTQDGQKFSSSEVVLPPEVAMDRLYAESVIENGEEGVQVFVDSDNAAGDARYFRYKYEETYEVLLPNPSGLDWRIFNVSDFTQTYELEIIERRLDLKCYSTVKSEGIFQTSTSNLGENRIFRHPIRFITSTNPIIKERYSIMVKQYVQSQEAYTFYKILKDLGNVESLLSQGQPGFVTGNIIAENDSETKVLGFLEVSSVSSKRIFFDRTNFGFKLPPYFVECEVLVLPLDQSLKKKLEFENYQILFLENIDGVPHYNISQTECSECETFSTHIKPDFWED